MIKVIMGENDITKQVYDSETQEINFKNISINDNIKIEAIANEGTNIAGDINNDGFVNENDLELLEKYQSGENVVIEEKNLISKDKLENLVYSEIIPGDVNGDGKITIEDCILVRKHAAKLISLTDKHLEAAEVDNSDGINILDASCIRRYVAKMIDIFPIQKLNEDLEVLGDVDNDGVLTLNDVELIRKYSAKILDLLPEDKLRADVNKDNKINILDASLLRRKIISEKDGLIGDIDEDGQITEKDAELLRKYLAKLISLTDFQIAVADVNNDGKINAIDANAIRRYANGDITEWT